MSRSEWWEWMKSLPLCLRWFVWLMLLRPLIDVFYFLKDISPFLSPLYIVGVGTPVAIIASYFSKAFPRRDASFADGLMVIWGGLLFFNSLAGLSFGVTLYTLEIALRLTWPVFVYAFLRRLIRSKDDLKGVLTTFVYSAVFPFAMLLYERVVSPVAEVIITRGYARYEGLYADVNSYSAYIMGAFLVSAYFFIDHRGGGSLVKRSLKLAVVGALSVLGLLSMQHAASWGVAAAVLVLLTWHGAKGNQSLAAMILILLCGPAYYFFGDAIEERIGSMYSQEIAVLEGERDVHHAFHGRMWRWQRHVDEWQEMPAHARFLGIALHAPPEGGKVGAGIHNDYLRILFSSGWIGLFLYLGFYITVAVKSLALPVAERFVVQGGIAMILLFSVTSVPTTSIPLLTPIFAIAAFGALPPPSRQPFRVPSLEGVPYRYGGHTA